MKLTRRTDYAIHLIADLSENPDKAVGLRALSEQHGVTYAFARTVQQGLLKAGIISTARGINGGMRLARSLKDITLLEVFEAAQDSLDRAFSTKNSPWCTCEGTCMSQDAWYSTRELLSTHLGGISLNEIIK